MGVSSYSQGMMTAIRERERQGTDCLLEPLKETQSCRHLDFRLWPPELCETAHFCCGSLPVCGTLLQQLQQMHTMSVCVTVGI